MIKPLARPLAASHSTDRTAIFQAVWPCAGKVLEAASGKFRPYKEVALLCGGTLGQP